jgi:hypothetical protein
MDIPEGSQIKFWTTHFSIDQAADLQLLAYGRDTPVLAIEFVRDFGFREKS